jgi:hypothetical protein
MKSTSTVISIILLVLLAACKNSRQYKLIGTTTREIAFAGKAYLKVDAFDNSDCDLACKKKITYVAINDNGFEVEANFEKKFRFAFRDSVVKQKLILKPGDSVVVACGCDGQIDIKSADWNMALTILSVLATDTSIKGNQGR